jgi:hypothetical protein
VHLWSDALTLVIFTYEHKLQVRVLLKKNFLPGYLQAYITAVNGMLVKPLSQLLCDQLQYSAHVPKPMLFPNMHDIWLLEIYDTMLRLPFSKEECSRA